MAHLLESKTAGTGKTYYLSFPVYIPVLNEDLSVTLTQEIKKLDDQGVSKFMESYYVAKNKYPTIETREFYLLFEVNNDLLRFSRTDKDIVMKSRLGEMDSILLEKSILKDNYRIICDMKVEKNVSFLQSSRLLDMILINAKASIYKSEITLQNKLLALIEFRPEWSKEL